MTQRTKTYSFNILKTMCAAAILMTLMSCATRLSLVDGYVKNAIRLNVKASKDLNYVDGQAHSLHLVVYELSSPDQFREMIKGKTERIRLLEANWKHKSVKSTREFSIQPNDERKIILDRVEDGRYLGIVTGYFTASKVNRMVKLYSTDLYIEKNILRQSRLKKLLVKLELGRTGLVD